MIELGLQGNVRNPNDGRLAVAEGKTARIDSSLAHIVERIPAAAIDFTQTLSELPHTTLVRFGNMMRVPGSTRSLMEAHRYGASTRIVYPPLDVVQPARNNPEEHFVLFAAGFETTALTTAFAALQAYQLELDDFSLLAAHVCVQQAMQRLGGIKQSCAGSVGSRSCLRCHWF